MIFNYYLSKYSYTLHLKTPVGTAKCRPNRESKIVHITFMYQHRYCIAGNIGRKEGREGERKRRKEGGREGVWERRREEEKEGRREGSEGREKGRERRSEGGIVFLSIDSRSNFRCFIHR